MSQPLRHVTRVFVADSSAISGQLLAESIGKDLDLNVLGYSSSPSVVMELVRASSIDVLLLSARIAEDIERGLAVLQEIRRGDSNVKIVMLLDSSRREIVVKAFRLGASGIFCRDAEIELLPKCIGAVHRGEIWANAQEVKFVVSALSTNLHHEFESRRIAPLTRRETEVVNCLVEGLTNREIARLLAISQHTVKNYIFKIFDKLGVSNRVELTVQVLSSANQSDSMNISEYTNRLPYKTIENSPSESVF